MPGRPHLRTLAALGLVVVLTGCDSGNGPVAVPTTTVSSQVASTCRTFLRSLPASVNDETARTVTPAGALGRAWGDPAIILTCGVPPAAGLAAGASCLRADGVDWYLAPEEVADSKADVDITTVGRSPRVRLHLPAAYRPVGLASSLADLSADVKAHLQRVDGCQ